MKFFLKKYKMLTIPLGVLISMISASVSTGWTIPHSTTLTIEEAVMMALEHNRALHVQRLEPEIRRTFIEQERGLYDPMLSGEIQVGRQRYGQYDLIDPRTDVTDGAELSISGFLPTGTRLEAEAYTQRRERGDQETIHETRLGLTVTQALLQGRGVAVNMVGIRQATLDTQMSVYELTGFTQSLVAQVEITYWEYVLALQQVKIVNESLDLAKQQLEETRQRVRVGGIAETEIAAANAEVALRREALINANSRVENLKTRLLRLVAPSDIVSGFREVLPASPPEPPPLPLETIPDHLGVAMHMRPDIRQAEMMIQKGDLEIVRTKNGMLPRMDLFVRLGKTGYADSFSESARDIDGDAYDAYAGIRVSRSVSQSEAGARHRRALLTRQQQEISLENLKSLVREDIELAYIEVDRTLQQLKATESTRRFQEEKVRAETAKFKVGKSTALLVAQAQRDLMESKVSEVESITNYLKARINFYLMEGSLLKRRGIDI